MVANRREFLLVVATVAAGTSLPSAALQGSAHTRLSSTAQALPLTAVRLLPSIYATAVEINRKYLLGLSADRLLHNFLLYAGLPPKAPIVWWLGE